jgi:predicted metallopeptidase
MNFAMLILPIVLILIIVYLIRLIKYKFKDLEKTKLVKVQIIIHIISLVFCILSFI